MKENKYIVLGVSFEWGYRKGQDIFNKIRRALDSSYIVVMVGTNDLIDRELSKEIIKIHKTKNAQELSKLYTMADVFINPTRDEALGMVNIESLACGTPVITFAGTGSEECINDKSGIVVQMNDVEGLTDGIKNICENKIISSSDCIKRSLSFDNNSVYEQYIALYNGIN